MGRLFNKLLFKYSCEIIERKEPMMYNKEEDFIVTIKSGNKPLLTEKYWVYYDYENKFNILNVENTILLNNEVTFENHFDLLPDNKTLNKLYKETKEKSLSEPLLVE